MDPNDRNSEKGEMPYMKPAPPVTSMLLTSGNGGNLVVPIREIPLLSGTSSRGIRIPLEYFIPGRRDVDFLAAIAPGLMLFPNRRRGRVMDGARDII